ncbi:CD1375 family protein [Paenibacillus ginsengarvi]|nr:CD1375 family protein [Paenibacillus ginsengarvi]
MVFAKDSGLVKVWVSLVMAGAYTLEQVPNLYNLKTVVTDVINGTA